MSKSKFLWVILLVILISLLPLTVKSGVINQGSKNSLFADTKARGVGDLLTVLVFESSQASNVAQTITKKENKVSVDGGPGIGALDFISLHGLESETKNEYTGQGQTIRRGDLKTKITVSVVAVRPNGDLVIEGSRVIGVNEDKETLILSGVVRPEDINPDNTIYSFNIAESQIVYKGKGAANTGRRPGLFVRLIQWLF